MREETRDYLELAKLNWAEGGEKDSDALWPIAAALISIAESHKRVADALEDTNNHLANIAVSTAQEEGAPLLGEGARCQCPLSETERADVGPHHKKDRINYIPF